MRARGLIIDEETGLRFWGPVLVNTWDSENGCWIVTWQNQRVNLIEVEVVFDCEPKMIFFERFKEALTSMANMNSRIKYKFILDAMEIDDLKPLDDKKVIKIS